MRMRKNLEGLRNLEGFRKIKPNVSDLKALPLNSDVDNLKAFLYA